MFRNLLAEKARKALTYEDFAKVMQVSPDTAKKKMQGKIEFKLREMRAVKETFFPSCSLEYLFAIDEKTA